MASGMRNASSILQQMKYSPIKQKEMEGAMLQEGRSNVAVSQEDRMLGRQVAGEQSRQMEVDKFGEAMAMRKDKLTFAKKIHSKQMDMNQDRLDMQEDRQKHKRAFDYIGIGVSSAGIGVGYLRNIKQKGMDEELAKENKVWKEEIRRMMGMKSKRTMIGSTLRWGSSAAIIDDWGLSQLEY